MPVRRIISRACLSCAARLPFFPYHLTGIVVYTFWKLYKIENGESAFAGLSDVVESSSNHQIARRELAHLIESVAGIGVGRAGRHNLPGFCAKLASTSARSLVAPQRKSRAGCQLLSISVRWMVQTIRRFI